jgi:hypothetical protein
VTKIQTWCGCCCCSYRWWCCTTIYQCFTWLYYKHTINQRKYQLILHILLCKVYHFLKSKMHDLFKSPLSKVNWYQVAWLIGLCTEKQTCILKFASVNKSSINKYISKWHSIRLNIDKDSLTCQILDVPGKISGTLIYHNFTLITRYHLIIKYKMFISKYFIYLTKQRYQTPY